MSKKLLIIGGTQMVGRDFVELLLELKNEYEIYIANRGITNNNLFPEINHICIDRNTDCSILKDKYFDIVVDFSCYNALQLYNIIKNIKYQNYIVISTLATINNKILNDTSEPLHNYAKYKKELERYILSNNLYNFTIVRPCVLYGKHDYTNRFYDKNNIIYWKYNNTEVVENKYYIPVRKFSQLLYNFIENNLLENNIIIHIDGDGISKQNIYNKKYNFNIHHYESKYLSIQKFSNPFNYIIIDNLFNQNIYKELCNKFPSFIARTTPYKDQPGATSNYEGYISGLGLSDLTDGYDFFASQELQNFVEKEFDIKTSKYIAPSAHFHKAPSKNGFIHRDMNICSFDPTINSSGFITAGGVLYTDDSNTNNNIKLIRSIAMLYYLNNDDSLDCIGGGTGIYSGYSGELLTTIEPKNNRLFIFEISHNSYHAFIGANYDRSAIVNWFHSSPAYIINRHKNNTNLIERWIKRPINEYWAIENDPEYHKYF